MLNLEGQILKGRYRIEQLIGRGGMAEVYQAWDVRRQYYVAVKVMREDLAEDLEFLQRFQREADALASLSHANIVRFYSFEQQGPLAFIVMDYVEGTTLRRRILEAGGYPLPLEEALSVTRQICAALNYAHNENVLHRDVKPGNIMIQGDGRVLVADFGIAKAADSSTATAVMPGTPSYMSPEQCRSELLDPRSDVYSLGVLVYEMLAGRRPFLGETADTATAGTREKLRWEQMHAAPPPLRQFNSAVPAEAEQVVFTALAKDREDRWPSAIAFWQALAAAFPTQAVVVTPEPVWAPSPVTTPQVAPAPAPGSLWAGGESPPPAPPAAGLPKGRAIYTLVWVVGALALLGAGILLLSARGKITPPATTSLAGSEARPLTLDGRTEIATARPAAAVPATPAPTPSDTPSPFPTPTETATPTLTPAPTDTPTPAPTNTPPPSWWPSSQFNLLVDATVARTETSLRVLQGERVIIEYLSGGWRAGPAPAWPQVGPRGDSQVPSKVTFPVTGAPIMSLVAGAAGGRAVAVGERIEFESDVTGYLWLGPNDDNVADNAGHLLVAVSVLTWSGSPPPTPPVSQIVFTCYIDGFDEVCTIGADGSSERRLTYSAATDWYAAFSPDGRQIIFSTRRDANFEVYLMDADGANQRRLTSGLGSLYAPDISPDGRLIVFTSARGNDQNIWLMDINGQGPRALTQTTGNNVDANWSPDGRRIAFSSNRGGENAHYVMDADGSGLRVLPTQLRDIGGRSAWSPDGRWLAFYAGPRDNRDLYMLEVNGTEVRRLTQGGNNVSPSFSPDGNWIAFMSTRDGDSELFVMRLDGTNVRQLTFNNRPDWQPRWGP